MQPVMRLIGAVLIGAAGGTAAHAGVEGTSNAIVFASTDRVLVLAPHPDDEVIGCGGVIQRCRAMGIPLRVVFFTYGDNNEWSFLFYRKHAVLLPSAVKRMGLLRHEEAVHAGFVLGLEPSQLVFLGYPDFGTYRIWMSHWGSDPPFESMLTRVDHVPYENALRPGALYRGDEIMRDLAAVITGFKPTKVFVSHPADFNVDHRALNLFTRVTLWTLEKQLRPELYPYLVHFPKWPAPRGKHSALPLVPPAFLAPQIEWKTLVLTTNELAGKEEAILQHRTQYEYAAHYLESFIRTNELFGDFPPVRLPAISNATADVASGPTAVKFEEVELDHLSETEREAFIGVEMRRIQVAEGNLMVSITLSRPLAETVSAAVQICGYRTDTPFPEMPKIKVEIGGLAHGVFDRGHLLPAKTATVSRSRRELDVSIPLKTLGSPERLLISARTYLGDIPLDWVSWREVDLRKE